MSSLSVIGAGSWGSALAVILAPRFEYVHLWARSPELVLSLKSSRQNDSYLPGVTLPKNVNFHSDLQLALDSSDTVLLAVPSQHLRSVLRRATLSPHMAIVSAVKGIETGTLHRMSQLIADELRFPAPVAVLSGPTFAAEVAAGGPAAVVISSVNADLASRIQSAFSGPTFRLYTNDDPIGVELGAALKNVIAIGAGICHGLDVGHNSVAALVTRGLAEITRLAIALGGKPGTLAGLAGLGDLVLTCTGALSRNRRLGIELAHGHRLETILASTKMVVEGVATTYAAVDLAQRNGVEMPIVQEMDAILRLGKQPRQGIRDLMDRSLKSE
ncbi:MAG: NAD(P)H-dependent glycerol-3-phosphate dehydrogenase [Bryobacteraceae bacterium]